MISSIRDLSNVHCAGSTSISKTEYCTPKSRQALGLIFRRYAKLGSDSLLSAELNRLGIMSRGALYLMLQNRIYRGDIVHQREAYPGQHEAIIDPELWQIVQDTVVSITFGI